MSNSNKINRRRFLKKTTASILGAVSFPYVVPSSVFGANGTTAPSNRIVMGCIGVGGMGTHNLRGFLLREAAQVVAVCDLDRNHYLNAQKMVNEKYNNKDCKTYLNFKDLLARSDIDAVSIATPDHWHAIIAISAAKAGKDIYSEKPLAFNIHEGRAICNAVKKYGRVWQTGSWQRSTSHFRHACELVRNGYIGQVHTVKVGLPYGNSISKEEPLALTKSGHNYDMWLGPAPWTPFQKERCHFNFRWNTDYSSGQLTDWGAHHCDIAQWGMGTEHTGPVEIEGWGVFPKEGMFNTAESYFVKCRYDEGFTMLIADDRQHKRGVRFEGTNGWLHVNREGWDANPKSLLNKRIGPNEIHLYKSRHHAENFLECIHSRSKTVAPVEVAHRSIAIAHLGAIAMKLGRKINWDPKKETFVNDPQAERLLSRPMRSPYYL